MDGRRHTRNSRNGRPVKWWIRASFAFVATTLGVFFVVQAYAEAIRGRNLDLAYALAPGNARISALFSSRFVDLHATPSERLKGEEIAREAIQSDATEVTALVTLGVNAEVRGDRQAARRLFAYSDKLSRRNLPTRLWMIEDAVLRGDIPSALLNYDIALRTSRSSVDILYPILAAASSDRDIAPELVKILSKKPFWAEGFVGYLAANTADPIATARLFRDLAAASFRVSDQVSTTLITALISRRAFDEAWAYYAAVRPGVDRRRIRDPQFAARLEKPSEFDWNPVNSENGLSATIQSDSSGSFLYFAAPATVGGTVLRQIQMLPVGVYRILGKSEGIDQPRESRPYWSVSCLDGRELANIGLPGTDRVDGVVDSRFSVPPGCPTQSVQLVLRPSNIVSGVSGRVDYLAIRPYAD